MQQEKDRFLESYRKRMADYEVEPDAGQWTLLQGRILRRRRRNTVYYSVAAVLVVLLGLTLGWNFRRDAILKPYTPDERRLALLTPPEPVIDCRYASPLPLPVPAPDPEPAVEPEPAESRPSGTPSSDTPRSDVGQPVGKTDPCREMPQPWEGEDPAERSGQINISLLGNSSMLTQAPGVSPVPMQSSDPVVGYNSLALRTNQAVPNVKDFVFNSEYDYDFRFPITFGVAARFELGKHFGVETGVFATKLGTDVLTKHGTQIGSLDFWYLGIPLRASWSFFSSRYVQLYLSAGGTVEKCISLSSFQVNTDLQARDLPLLFSVNANIGFQFDIIPEVSIFLEPGLSYYFDKKNPLPTIRRERPFNFNLQGGLRFNIFL